ncbi:hypothetical protein [Ktedonobacter robiniae]|uniref:Polymerase nucleotidyl transferase domain-containing protein n=1 Tax=Ktedonobacter robiniae TaxID=2778365 RepID=A0ABQ3UN88_9CHLR|nr:hypothetical protein [Ktedonobacter robiniae]GHO54221.1 hypothetical protein KSB_26960 [Ktedonobacter robiniae]
MFDVTPLDPLVRPLVLAAAEVYYKHTQPWFIALALHGSAYKGGYIPGCSDIDFKLFLRGEALSFYGELPLEIGQAIQEDLSRIDPAPFQYFQTYILTVEAGGNRPDDWSRPIPGTYHMLAGKLPAQEMSETETLEKCRATLKRLPKAISEPAEDMLHHGAGKLERSVRFLCTSVWPILYSYISIETGQPFAIWSLPKDKVLALLPENQALGQAIRHFHKQISSYFSQPHTTRAALQTISAGVHFLQLIDERLHTQPTWTQQRELMSYQFH